MINEWTETHLIVVDAIDVEITDLVILKNVFARRSRAFGERCQQFTFHTSESC